MPSKFASIFTDEGRHHKNKANAKSTIYLAVFCIDRRTFNSKSKFSNNTVCRTKIAGLEKWLKIYILISISYPRNHIRVTYYSFHFCWSLKKGNINQQWINSKHILRSFFERRLYSLVTFSS